jgi:hypothetical protein
MTDGIAFLDALVDNGVVAYKNRNFKSAIDNLQKVLDVDPRHWRAKLYLAMSYYQGGELYSAFRHFTYLTENCTDTDIRDKAAAALRVINGQVKRTPSQGVPVSKSPDKVASNYGIEDVSDEALGLEWVPVRDQEKHD